MKFLCDATENGAKSLSLSLFPSLLNGLCDYVSGIHKIISISLQWHYFRKIVGEDAKVVSAY